MQASQRRKREADLRTKLNNLSQSEGILTFLELVEVWSNQAISKFASSAEHDQFVSARAEYNQLTKLVNFIKHPATTVVVK